MGEWRGALPTKRIYVFCQLHPCLPPFKNEKANANACGTRNLVGQPPYFSGKIGCWPLRLKITKDAILHDTRTRQKSRQDQTSFWPLFSRRPGKLGNHNRGQLYCKPLLSTCPPHREVSGLSPLVPGFIFAKTRKSFSPPIVGATLFRGQHSLASTFFPIFVKQIQK